MEANNNFGIRQGRILTPSAVGSCCGFLFSPQQSFVK